MKVIGIIFLVHYVIFTDAEEGASKYCKTADEKWDELKEMIESLNCPCPGSLKIQNSFAESLLASYFQFFISFYENLWNQGLKNPKEDF